METEKNIASALTLFCATSLFGVVKTTFPQNIMPPLARAPERSVTCTIQGVSYIFFKGVDKKETLHLQERGAVTKACSRSAIMSSGSSIPNRESHQIISYSCLHPDLSGYIRVGHICGMLNCIVSNFTELFLHHDLYFLPLELSIKQPSNWYLYLVSRFSKTLSG